VPDDEVGASSRGVERLTYFSDAVVAIAITLLALELPVPEGGTVPEFLTSVRHDAGHYAAFLISFTVIAVAWLDHYGLFRYVKGTDNRLLAFNIAWLLAIVLNPFATKLLVVSGATVDTHALRFGFYALLQVLGSAALLAMLGHLTSRGLTDSPLPVANRMAWQYSGLLLGFALSIPVFFATTYAWVLWVACPLLAWQVRRRRQRQFPGAEA
jgi:uncharacterized membrane protein